MKIVKVMRNPRIQDEPQRFPNSAFRPRGVKTKCYKKELLTRRKH